MAIRAHNPLLFDFVLKRLLRAGGKRLAPAVFHTRDFFLAQPPRSGPDAGRSAAFEPARVSSAPALDRALARCQGWATDATVGIEVG
jgi:hypothetical protein